MPPVGIISEPFRSVLEDAVSAARDRTNSIDLIIAQLISASERLPKVDSPRLRKQSVECQLIAN